MKQIVIRITEEEKRSFYSELALKGISFQKFVSSVISMFLNPDAPEDIRAVNHIITKCND